MSGFSCYSDFSQSGLDGIVCRRGECRHAFFERRADAFGKVGIEDTFDDRGAFERELLGQRRRHARSQQALGAAQRSLRRLRQTQRLLFGLRI